MGSGYSHIRDTPAKWTGGQRAVLAFMIISLILVVSTAITVLVLGGLYYNTCNEAKNDLKDLTDRLASLDTLNNTCFSCNVKTGDITFTSTLDFLGSWTDQIVNFKNQGFVLPGYAFGGSDRGIDGNPTLLGDLIVAEALGQKNDPQLLPQTDSNSAPLSPQPNPGIFFGQYFSAANSPTMNYGLLGIGNFVASKTVSAARCQPSAITDSPTIYVLVDDVTVGCTAMGASCYRICTCAPSGHPGTGEHCSSTTFAPNYFS